MILFLVLAGMAVYANCLGNEMFWDDEAFIINNRFIQDWHYWPRFFTDNLGAGAYATCDYWRPLLQGVFAVEWHLWQTFQPGWHLVSVFLHIADAALVFLLISRLFTSAIPAFLAALIFLVHPLQTETVVYANSQGDSLALLFILLGLYALIRYRAGNGRRNFHFAVLCFPLALMSKEIGIIMPAFVLLGDLYCNASLSVGKRALRAFRLTLPFLLIAIAYACMRAVYFHFDDVGRYYLEWPDFQSSALVRAFTFFRLVPDYAGLVLWPADLQFDRACSIAGGQMTPMIALGGMILAGMAVAVSQLYRRAPAFSFGAAWTLIAIFPYSNIPRIINALFYEHYLYIPLIGIGIMAGALFSHVFYRDGRVARIPAVLFVCVIFLLGARTMLRNADWRTAIRFYEKTSVRAPMNYRLFVNLGRAYAAKGLYEKAEKAFVRALSISPGSPAAWHNLGLIARAQGLRDKAVFCFEKAISVKRDYFYSYNALAEVYDQSGDRVRLRHVLERSLPYSREPAWTKSWLESLKP